VALRILEITRASRPEMPVIVRTMDDADLDRLLKAGATEVVPESLEGSLMMGSHVLLLLGVPAARIVRHVNDVREDRYRMMRGFFHGDAIFGEQATEAWRERLHSITLPPGAYAIDKSLAELNLARLGVTVSTVRRNGRPAPAAAETRFAAGDVLVLHGSAEALEEAEAVLLEG
jgi:CPA2 family monovalent cation:H+ antiporter-2